MHPEKLSLVNSYTWISTFKIQYRYCIPTIKQHWRLHKTQFIINGQNTSTFATTLSETQFRMIKSKLIMFELQIKQPTSSPKPSGRNNTSDVLKDYMERKVNEIQKVSKLNKGGNVGIRRASAMCRAQV